MLILPLLLYPTSPPTYQELVPLLTDPIEYAGLLRDIDGYRGEATTKAAMQLLALTFQRTKEVRYAEWSQFDMEAALWRIPVISRPYGAIWIAG